MRTYIHCSYNQCLIKYEDYLLVPDGNIGIKIPTINWRAKENQFETIKIPHHTFLKKTNIDGHDV